MTSTARLKEIWEALSSEARDCAEEWLVTPPGSESSRARWEHYESASGVWRARTFAGIESPPGYVVNGVSKADKELVVPLDSHALERLAIEIGLPLHPLRRQGKVKRESGR